MNQANERLCGFYLRVSTDQQADRPDGSLKTQEQRLRAYLDSKTNADEWNVVDVYTEIKSGKDTDRHQLHRLMNDIRNGRINTVLTIRLDRLTRSLLDFYKLNKVFEENNVKFISLNESFDTTTATGRAMLKITLIFAELEREQIAERMVISNRQRAENGLWTGKRLLGYDPNPNRKGYAIVNMEEAETVKAIYQIHLEQGSIRKTVKAVYEAGYRTKKYTSQRGKRHGGDKLHRNVLHNILTNLHYLGRSVYKDENFPGKQKAIIDKRTFEKVQALLKANGEERLNKKSPTNHVFQLQGLVMCGPCGELMHNSSGTGKSGKAHYQYACKSKDKKTGKHTCKVGSVPAQVLENAVVKVIRKHAHDPERVNRLVKEANYRKKKEGKPLISQKRSLERQLQEVEDRGAHWAQQILDEKVKETKYVLKEMKALEEQENQIRKEIIRLEDQIRLIEARVVNAEIVKKVLSEFDQIFDALAPDEQKSAIQMIVRHVIYRPGSLEIELMEGRTLNIELIEKKGKKKGTTGKPKLKGSASVPLGS